MKTNVSRALLGGFIGTLALTFLMYIGGPMMGLPKMDIAAMLGGMLGGWTIGMMMHVVNGTVIFPLIFAYFLFGKLPGAPYLKGILWGVTLWLMAQLVVMPMMGAGVFGLKMGGIMAAFGSLMGHVIYGGILGAIAGHPQSAGLERTKAAA